MEFLNENQPNSGPPPHTTSIAHGHDDQPAVDPEFIKNFREQVHGLGALWIFIGAMACVLVGLTVSVIPLAKDFAIESSLLLILLTGHALVWIALGVLTCLKQIWAVYVGLVLTYLALLGRFYLFLFEPSLWGILLTIIFVTAILRAHRVIRWARQIIMWGLPLTTKSC